MKKSVLFVLLLLLVLTSCTAVTPPVETTASTGTNEIETGTESSVPVETTPETQTEISIQEEMTEANTKPNEPTVTIPNSSFSTDAYTVSQVSGQYYLNFKDGYKASAEDIKGCEQANITFDSLADMKSKLQNGNLSTSEQIIMQAAFPKDENGILMCDLTKLYEPILPDGVSYSKVSWSGGTAISFAFSGGTFLWAEESTYNARLQREYVHAPNTTNYTITSDQEGTYDGHPCRWIELTRTNGLSFRIACIEITVDGRAVYAVLNFSAADDTGTAPEAPFTGTIMTELNGQYIIITIANPTTAPTVEWLSSFGITPYVDNADHVTA